MEAECQTLTAFLVQGNAVLKILGPEQAVMTKQLQSMVEYEASLVAEAVVSAAVITYGGVFSPRLRRHLFDEWTRELDGQPLQIHPTHSILNNYAAQPFGLWLHAAGLFHSRHSQQTAYILAHALPVVLVTSFSPHMDSLLRNVLHSVGCNSIVTKSALDKDVRSVLESCISMGQQLIVNDVTPRLYTSTFQDLVEWGTEWVDGVEYINYIGHTLALKRGFRLVLTTTAPLCEFGSEVFQVATVDAVECWDDMQNVLLDDIELANVCNDRAGVGAYDFARAILDMEVDMSRSFDGLLVHLRTMIRETKYDAPQVESLATMCNQNAQHRATFDERRQELHRTMAARGDVSYAAVTQLGHQIFTALQKLATLVPDLVMAFEPYGFRIFFIQCLESCDGRSKAPGARCPPPGDVLVKLLELLALTIPQLHWSSFLLLLAFEVRGGPAKDAKASPPHLYDLADDAPAEALSFMDLQRNVLFPPHWNASLTDATINDMTAADQLFQAYEGIPRDSVLMKRPRHLSMPSKQPSQQTDASVHSDGIQSIVSMPPQYLCLGVMLAGRPEAFASFCDKLVLFTLGLEPKQPAARRTWHPKDWSKILYNTQDAWFWCVVSNAGFSSLELLYAVLDTIVPRDIWPDVLKLLLQRPVVHALSFHVPLDGGSIMGFFDSVPSMVQFEGLNPIAFESLRWFVLDMTTSDKWDAVVQYNKKRRLDYRPVGLVSHLKPTLGKPMNQRHAADDDMQPSRMVHVVPTTPAPTHTQPLSVANVPLAVQPNRLVLHPLGSNPFSTEFRLTLLRLVAIPFSTAIGDALEGVNMDPAVRNVVAIVLWRLLCGLVFFHAALVARQDKVVGCAVDMSTVDGSDLVLGVYMITGPLLQTIVRAFLETVDGDPLEQLNWGHIHNVFVQHAHGRKCRTHRGRHWIRALLRECIGPYLLVPNSPPQQSKFQLPLPSFQDVLKTPTQSSEEYLTVMCAFASSCKWTVPDVVVPSAAVSIDLRSLVLLPQHLNSPNHVKKHVLAIVQLCLQSLPPALPLKLHPRNALVQHPLRQFLKTVIHSFHHRRDHTELALQALLSDITQASPATVAAFVATTNNNDLKSALAMECRALVLDKIPARVATYAAPLDMSLSVAIKHWQRTGSFLQLWWDEGQTEYWCPGIVDVTDLMAAFGFTYKIATNTVANVDLLAFAGQVYPMETPLDAFRNRNDTILLTGLELLNAIPSPTTAGGIQEAAGCAVPVQVLLKVSASPPPINAMECPILRSRCSSVSVGSLHVDIVPAIQEWATCPYLVLSVDDAR